MPDYSIFSSRKSDTIIQHLLNILGFIFRIGIILITRLLAFLLFLIFGAIIWFFTALLAGSLEPIWILVAIACLPALTISCIGVFVLLKHLYGDVKNIALFVQRSFAKSSLLQDI